MEELFWEANCHSPSQDIPRILWNRRFITVLKGPLLVPIQSQMNPVPRPFSTFRNKRFLRSGVVSPSPNPQARGPPLVGCPRLLMLYVCSYPHLLHPPCRGNREPHNTDSKERICKTHVFRWNTLLRFCFSWCFYKQFRFSKNTKFVVRHSPFQFALQQIGVFSCHKPESCVPWSPSKGSVDVDAENYEQLFSFCAVYYT
jgi:hypothetical protein